MIILIIIFASFILLAGVAMMVNPAYFARLLADSAYRVELRVLAVVIRCCSAGCSSIAPRRRDSCLSFTSLAGYLWSPRWSSR